MDIYFSHRKKNTVFPYVLYKFANRNPHKNDYDCGISMVLGFQMLLATIP